MASPPDPRDGRVDRAEVAAFWDAARAAADDDQQTGYLQDEWPAALGWARFDGERREVWRWLDQLGVAGGACLDVGCGVGAWLEAFAGRFDRVHGVDLSREMVAAAQARVARRGLAHVTVACGSVTDLAGDGAWDLIFVGGVFTYLGDAELDPTMARLAAMLRPGGVLVLRESTARTTWYRDTPLVPGLFADPAAPPRPYHAIYRPAQVYRDLVARHGLVIARRARNRHYALAGRAEAWLRAIDRLGGGWLARRPPRAERAARLLHRLRVATLVPHDLALRALRGDRLANHWVVARRPR